MRIKNVMKALWLIWFMFMIFIVVILLNMLESAVEKLDNFYHKTCKKTINVL
jgi:hypothetical protein